VLVLIASSLFLVGLVPAGAQEPVARFILYYGETCPHCHDVMDNYLPGVYEKYGDQVEYRYVEVWSDPDSYVELLALEAKLGVPEDRQGSVPVLVIGDKVLVGAREIPDKLEGYIDEYLAQGGVDFPSLDDLPEVVLPTPVPAVQILLFFDSTDPSFETLNAFVSGLGQEYGGQLQAYAADVSTPENAEILAQINDVLGVQPGVEGTPQVLVDRQMLVGLDEIQSELPGLVETLLAQGGSSLPTLEELLGGQPTATVTPAASATPGATATPGLVITQPAEKPIYLAYFEQAGCQNCARTSYDLNVVVDRYPQLVIESFSMEEDENKALNEWLSDKYGVPEEQRLTTPMIFVGEDVLIGTGATLNPLLETVGKYAATGAERTWEEFDPEEAEQRLVDRFQSFGVLTVFGAGLIDGLNPCAFATLVFFVSYLTFTGRKGREILFVGISFTLGVFITYLLVGVGLLKVIQSLSFFNALGRWVYLITALLCLVLAVLTFRDFFRARKGQASEMTLKLPMTLRRRINKVIREGAQVQAFVAMAFVTGFLVSLIELACTGQVYVPTIVYVLSQPELAAQAFLYLVIYCLAFILPLVVVFVLSYFGTTSEQLGQFVNRHTATIKLVTGVVFLGLGLWMTYTLAPLFGITSPWNWVLMAALVLIAVAVIAVLKLTDKPETTRRTRKKTRART
jgi:cytochrome c biogenesis protein CcdA/glutaredoxin